jgi:predicted outer membrane repeat protein
MTMMCMTLVLIGLVYDVKTAAGVDVGDGTLGSCTQDALQTAVTIGGTVTFKCGSTATINIITPIISATEVTIDGGGNKIAIDGGNTSSLFSVQSGSLTLIGLTLVNGYIDGNGGAIQNYGGQLNIVNCTLAHNDATGSGGAIWGGTTTIQNSTLTDNSAGGNGGAIYFRNYSLLRLNRSTIVDNAAGGWGGGVFFEGEDSSTIWYDTILAGNSAGSYADCYAAGFYYSIGSIYGVLGQDRCGVGNDGGNIVAADPLLESLADNGGPTPTMRPLPGSPAIHNGNPNGYPGWDWQEKDEFGNGVQRDQRGYLRTSPYDIGAVQISPLILNTIGNKTVLVTNVLTFGVTAIGGTVLTYTATGLPAGASFDPLTHTFRWRPTTKQIGTYNVTFTVTDNEVPPEIASETITITVTGPNRPPVFSPLPKYNTVFGKSIQFSVSASDPDGNAVSYSLSNPPTGAAINGTSGLFQWTPSATGVYKVTFIATDDGAPAMSSSMTTSISVTKK